MKKEILKYLAGRLIPALANLAFILLAMRYLGPAAYGRYSLLLYTALLAITLGFHWVQVSILRFLGSMPREAPVAMSRFFDLTLISALFSTAVVALAAVFYFHISLPGVILISLFTLLNNFYLFHQAILQAYNRSVRMAILEGTGQLLIILALLSGIFIFHSSSYLLLIASMTAGMAGALVMRMLIREKGLLQVDITHFYWDGRFSGKVMETGFGIALWLFCSHLLMAADRFILMEYLGYRDAGMYAGLKDILYKWVTVATLPIYLSYQAKITDQWNGRHRSQAWATVKEALSFEFFILITVFIIFMISKKLLLTGLWSIPESDSWAIYLPLLLSAFTWQVILLLQRFLELGFRYSRMLAAIGLCVVVNIILNLVFVPRFGLAASALALLASTLLYAAFLLILSRIATSHIAHPDR